ncbi:MAG: hypothetical protein E7L00_11410 [Propionibacteriaceae bacterium]|nr:hypothetical protein [Propionibacteriaceae bacterium]
MIVRIMGEGQWTVDVDALESLNEIDERLESAVEAGDEASMREVLRELFDKLCEVGTPVPDDVLAESDVVLPDPSASLEEVKLVLEATNEYYDGLIPDEPVK